jgi:type IV secretion system protein VirB1
MTIAIDASFDLFRQCAPQVAPETIAAIVRTESGGNPLAININYKKVRLARRPSSLYEAIGWSKWLIQNGYNVDMGLMQVNSQHLQRYNLTVENVFDPCTNIRVGGGILTESYLKAKNQYGHGQNALFASLSAYNTGNFRRGFNNGYVSRVVKNAGKPVVIPTMQTADLAPPLASNLAEATDTSSANVASAGETRHSRGRHRHHHRHRSSHSSRQQAFKEPQDLNVNHQYVVSPSDAPTAIEVN